MFSNSITTQNTLAIATRFQGEVDLRSFSESPVRTLAGAPHWALFKYITSMSGIPLTDQHKAMITDNVKIKKLRKRQYFLQEGDVCKYIGFLTKGSTRMFSINDRGHESIISFGLENSWIVDQGSFGNADCSVYHIEAMEDCELLLLNCTQVENLKNNIPAFAAMLSQYQLQQLIYAQKRINAALSMTAEERYYDLLDNQPIYAQKFSQNMLACYLGLKPETLSRIRKR